ncbi:TIGR04282 family arsenosugar biosynthesis glycosyltransferase [Nonlabens antarcticus]|uniref:TIGR04282 family arsenosugar biosynthesis glycosyltransferase n=1 Tax=Nonlabens antarcticus TaxID=392714 RepID=UPI0018915B0F
MQVLNDRILQTVKKSGLDFYHYSEKEQYGIGFGNRFSNAIQDVFDKGYEHVICLGNDTPQLRVAQIHTALDCLHNGIAVNGPSLDGGFYLMGISKSQFDKQHFENLPWQTSNLAAAYLKFLDKSGIEVKILEHLADLDSTEDIHRFLNGCDQRSIIIQLILGTLTLVQNSNHFLPTRKPASVIFRAIYNKGSPLLAA